MLIRRIIIFCVIFVMLDYSKGEETFCTVNGKRALQKVSENFLSISIDPAVLLAGLNLSDSSLRLAKHLSPAFIRIAGPSTQFVKYVDNEDKSREHKSGETTNVVVTPSTWFGINEWLRLANLTPVFAINDAETSKGVWNPKSTLPLLELSDKLNVSCFWQLGYDCSNKSEKQYKQDITIFHHILEAFPERNETWKIIGSDMSRCISSDHIETARNTMHDLKDTVEAIMWEPGLYNQEEGLFLEKDTTAKINFQGLKPIVPLWACAPKTNTPVSFTSALIWAKQLGQAAKQGYEVVFRQPRLHELFSDTPAYWFSLLHKKLMGSNVLDVRHLNSEASVFAHCTKQQNSFIRRGAITVLVVNNKTENYKVMFRLGFPHTKTVEVQSYILTSSDEDSTEILLNGEKLSPKLLEQDKIHFTPKLRRAKATGHVDLEVPAKSIGFFVLPGARIPVCVNEENELNLLLEEIYEDQHLPLSQEIVLEMVERSAFNKPTLKQLKDKMERELESDEQYYKKPLLKTKKSLLFNSEEKPKRKITLGARNYFIDRARLAEKHQKHVTKERKPEITRQDKFLAEPVKEPVQNKDKLNLSSAEVAVVLKSRARTRAAKKHIVFTSEELDELIGKASNKFQRKYKRDINMKRLNMKEKFQARKDKILRSPVQVKEKFSQKLQKMRENKRFQRDINMDMLKIKTEGFNSKKFQKMAEKNSKKSPKSKFHDKEEKEATMHDPNKTSEELMDESEIEDKSKESHLRHGEIYAELADSDEEETEEVSEKPNKFNLYDRKFKTNKNYFTPSKTTNKWSSRTEATPKKNKKRTEDEDTIQVLTESDEFDDFEDDFPCIHEYFGSDVKPSTDSSPKFEIWEIEQQKAKNKEEKKNKKAKKNSSSSEESPKELERDEGDLSEESDDGSHNIFKRDLNLINKEDVKNYKKIIRQKVKEMKNFALTDRIKAEEDTINQKIKTLQEQNEKNMNKLGNALGGQTGDFSKTIKDEKKSVYKKIQTLQNKLGYKKKIGDLLRKHAKQIEDSKELINTQTDLKKRIEQTLEARTKQIREKIDTNPKIEPHKLVRRSLLDKQLPLFGNYKSLTKGLKPWHPSDIRMLKRNVQFTKVDRPKMLRHLEPNNYLRKIKRSLFSRANSAENEIGSFFNEIEKDTKFIHPKLDMENGDYQLILPNKDKFEIQEKLGNSKIEFHQYGNDNSKKIHEGRENVKENKTKSKSKTLSNIQKISTKDEEALFRKIFTNVSDFFRNVGGKIKSCIEYFTVKK